MKRILCVSLLPIVAGWVLACTVKTEPELELGNEPGDGGAAGSPMQSGGGVKDEVDPTSTCGDGEVEGDETCDDGNSASGDGCSEECALESGYRIRAAVVEGWHSAPVDVPEDVATVEALLR